MNKLLPIITAMLIVPAAAEASPVAGGGLSVGTMVIPGKYPLKLPNEVSKNDESTIEKVGGDAHIGLEGVYYMNDENRLGLSADLGFGGGHFDRNFLLKYGRIIDMDAASLVIGGGAGVGKSTFNGDSSEKLDVPYYPIRGEFGPMFRQDFLAEQLLLFTQYNITYDNTYTDSEGAESDAGVGLFWTAVGIELQVMFGNFSG